MYNSVAIIYTTFLRDNLLFQTLPSVLDNLPDNSSVFVADQGNMSVEKTNFYDSARKNNPRQVTLWYLPFDCGLSYARNKMVQDAHELGFQYVLLSADSLKFTSKYNLQPFIDFLDSDPSYGIVGFKVQNKREWNYYMSKTDAFELRESNDFVQYKDLRLKKVDITLNFFLAKIETLLACPWNEKLRLCEHECHSWDLKTTTPYKVFFSDTISCEYIRDREGEYKKMRLRANFEYAQLAMKIYNLKQFVRIIKEE